MKNILFERTSIIQADLQFSHRRTPIQHCWIAIFLLGENPIQSGQAKLKFSYGENTIQSGWIAFQFPGKLQFSRFYSK